MANGLGLGLAEGYGAGGIGEALQDLLKQRYQTAAFAELQRHTLEEEAMRREDLGLRRRQQDLLEQQHQAVLAEALRQHNLQESGRKAAAAKAGVELTPIGHLISADDYARLYEGTPEGPGLFRAHPIDEHMAVAHYERLPSAKEAEQRQQESDLASYLTNPRTPADLAEAARYTQVTGKPAPARLITGAPIGTFEDYVKRAITTRGEGAKDLTDTELLDLHSKWSAAAREPDVTVPLSPAGLDAAALNYARTGQLPPMGMGKVSTAARARIINRAAELNPDLDLALKGAEYRSKSAALTQLQKNFSAVSAFEQTALKNADILTGAMEKIPDTGSPILNRPLRAIGLLAAGSPEQAAYATALRTVQPEFARILANPTLSGELSDTARREMQEAIRGDATLSQMKATLTTLKADAANRRSAYQAQIQQLQQELRGVPGPGAGPALSTPDMGTSGPVKGTRKTNRAGMTVEFDGTQWKVVP